MEGKTLDSKKKKKICAVLRIESASEYNRNAKRNWSGDFWIIIIYEILSQLTLRVSLSKRINELFNLWISPGIGTLLFQC